MQKLVKSALLAAGAVALSTGIVAADAGADRAKIESVLRAYERALNASDTGAVMALYADDGVFMPMYYPSAVGAKQVRAAYDAVFATIKLDVKFHFEEVVPVSENWAFARTNSAGTVKVLANDKGSPEHNQELFVLQRVNGDWKIARYAFSNTNPPKR